MFETFSIAMKITEKIEKLYKLLDLLHWDDETNTLTIDSSINIKVKGDYKMDTDRHIRINSNYLETDPELDIPYSYFINSDELEFKEMKEKTKKLLD